MANGDKEQVTGLLGSTFEPTFQGLLGDPVFNVGLGLLAAGLSHPKNLGTALAQGLQTGGSLQAQREKIMRKREEEQRRQRLVERLQQLGPQVAGPGAAGQVAASGGAVPGQPDPVFGLLAEAAPEKLAAAMIEQRFATPETQEFVSPIGKLFADRDLAEQSGNQQAVAAIDQAIKGQLGPNVDLTKVRQFRNDAIKNSGEFTATSAAFDRVRAGALNPSPAGDIALVFNFMKMLDPASVVREGEFATAESAAGIPERIRGTYNRLLRGERLTPSQRTDFLKQARSQAESAAKRQQRLVDDFTAFANRHGFSPQDVVPSFVIPQPLPQIGTPQPKSTGQGRTSEKPLTETERQELNRLRRDLGVGG